MYYTRLVTWSQQHFSESFLLPTIRVSSFPLSWPFLQSFDQQGINKWKCYNHILFSSPNKLREAKMKYPPINMGFILFCFVFILFFLEGGEGMWAKFSMATFLQLKLKGNFFKNWAWSPVLGIRRYWNSTQTSWLFIVHSHITLK